MSGLSGWSDLAIVTAMVLFIVALAAHALEWAAANGAAKLVVPGRTTAVRKADRRALVTAGGGVETVDGRADLADDTDSDTADSDIDSDTDAEADAAARAERRVELFGRLGLNITVIALACNILGVVFRGIAGQRAPWGNMYEFTITAVAMIVLAYVVMAFRFQMRWLGLIVTLVAAIGLGLAREVFYVQVAALVPALHSVWFIIHIVAAAIAGAAFNLGAIASILYLVKARKERRESVSGYWAKLPSSQRLDALAYRMNAFAFPLWTFAVAAGAVWAQYAWGRFWGWDPKETWALVTWVIYACYLHARATAGWKGGRAATIAIVGVASFWFNFIGVNILFSGLHSYAGI